MNVDSDAVGPDAIQMIYEVYAASKRVRIMSCNKWNMMAQMPMQILRLYQGDHRYDESEKHQTSCKSPRIRSLSVEALFDVLSRANSCVRVNKNIVQRETIIHHHYTPRNR